MAKRFIDTSKYRQAWRKLDPRFRAAYAWLVENADAAGFWVVDLDFFKFECGYALELDKFIKAVGGAVVRHGLDKINLVDFIQVNYGELKEGYNPHKPALRALHSSTLTGTTSSLNQAWPKLEDEEEDEEEDVSKKKERAKVEPEPKAITWPRWAGPNTLAAWEEFKTYRWAEHKVKYQSVTTEQKAVNILSKFFPGGEECVNALEYSMGKRWQFPVDPAEHKYPTERKAVSTGWNPRA